MDTVLRIKLRCDLSYVINLIWWNLRKFSPIN